MKNYNKHPGIVYAADLAEICQPLESLGITYFGHGHRDAEGRSSGIAMNPDFLQHYFKKGYYQYDLHMSRPKAREQYILWDAIERTKQSKVLHDDFVSFGQAHTFTIIESQGNTCDCFHFATRPGNNSINNTYFQNLETLKKFILYFKDKVNAHKELRSAYDFKLNTDHSESGYYTKEAPFLLADESLNEKLAFDRIYVGADKKSYLTKREYECLYWRSQGKTAEEISIILEISLRTVKAHVQNIKLKLNCVNQFQLGVAYSKLQDLVKIDQ